ncbi:hypothetical protein [Rhizobium phage RHph_X2_26]|nr:hypothetical protein [Rhizobium phage RHph_X2_26]
MRLKDRPSEWLEKLAEWHERRRRAAIVWHEWFAWFPVRVSGDEFAWLETVSRRRAEERWGETYWLYREKI